MRNFAGSAAVGVDQHAKKNKPESSSSCGGGGASSVGSGGPVVALGEGELAASGSLDTSAVISEHNRGKKRKMGDRNEVWCRSRQNGVVQPLLTGDPSFFFFYLYRGSPDSAFLRKYFQ